MVPRGSEPPENIGNFLFSVVFFNLTNVFSLKSLSVFGVRCPFYHVPVRGSPSHFPRRLLPLLVNAEGKCRGRTISPLWVRWGGVWERWFTWLCKTNTKMWDRLDSIITFSLSSFVRLSRYALQSQKVPTFTPSNCRGWEQSLPFSWKPAALPAYCVAGVLGPPRSCQLNTREPCQDEKEGDGSWGH